MTKHYMDIGTLKSQIIHNTLEQFYIFTGEESYVQKVYINKISEISQKPMQSIDRVADIVGKKSSLINVPKVYICRDDIEFIKTEKAWNIPKTMLGNNILILVISEVDKRLKFFKQFADSIIQFDLLQENFLYKHISKEIELSENNIYYLIDLCEHNYTRILLEINKIKVYSAATNISLDGAFKKLVEAGTIYSPPQDAIFDFVNAVLTRDSNKAYDMLQHCKNIEEPALRLISVLYINVKKVLQVQSCKSSNVSVSTGLSAWDIKCVSDKLNYWCDDDLVYMLQMLRQLERGIKIGTIDEDIAIDYFMSLMF